MTTSPETPDPLREPFSLAPLLTTLWGYRRPAVVAIALVMMLYAAYALVATIRTPVERIAALGIQLTFDGADRGEYPNGTPFTAGDIIAPAVLAAVHDANDLARYVTIDELRSSLSVTQSSPELTILTRSYEARLADPSLNAVLRAELEQQFQERRAAMRLPNFSLQFVQRAYATAIPDALLQKVLIDILSTWESVSRDRRSVVRYETDAVQDTAALSVASGQPAAIRLDMIRRLAGRMVLQAEALSRTPGVQGVTTIDGVTSGQNRAQLDDLQGVALQVALSRALRAASGDEAATVQIYLQARLSDAERRRNEQGAALAQLETTLRLFSADGVPVAGPAPRAERGSSTSDSQSLQLSESFLTSLLAMARRQEDFEYRQSLAARIFTVSELVARHQTEADFYRGLLNHLAPGGPRMSPLRTEDVDAIESRLMALISQQAALWQQVAALNLDRGALYRVGAGFDVATLRGVDTANLVYAGLSVFLLSLILIPLACLAHHTFWRRRRT